MKKIYWHIQMFQHGTDKIELSTTLDMLNETTPLIGIAEWEEKPCNYFKGIRHDNNLEKGSIIMVRYCKEPIALCEVISDYFNDPTLQEKYKFENYRKVKILQWYKDYATNESWNNPQGALQPLVHDTPSWNFINNWYKKILSIMQVEKLKEILKIKKQIILQGAPGTGKTRMAKVIAERLTSDENNIKLLQFHPSYTYEDFVRGIVASENDNGQITYVTKNKVLAELAQKAQQNREEKYVIIIDEINRANLPSVLGELIYALEYRGKSIESMYNINEDSTITLPDNLYIIGTMNTADRSVGHIDYAIRRRFAFVDVLPKDLTEEMNNDSTFETDLFKKVSKLFIENYDTYKQDGEFKKSEHLSADFRPEDVWLGHSYFITGGEFPNKNIRLEYEIKPILKEYIKDGILKESAETIINAL